MTRRQRWALGLAVVVAAQIVLVLVCNRIDVDRERASPPVRAEQRNQPASDVEVETFGGEQLVVRAQSGRYQLVHFWATWCPPCRVELPALLEMASRHRDRLAVWAVSVDPEWAVVQRFMSDDVPSLVVRDVTGAAARSYGVSELPDSYLVDPDGVIRARFFGAQNWSAREMEKVLEDLMRESS